MHRTISGFTRLAVCVVLLLHCSSGIAAPKAPLSHFIFPQTIVLAKPVVSPLPAHGQQAFSWHELRQNFKELRKQIKAARKMRHLAGGESAEDKKLYNLSLWAGILGMGGLALIFIPYIGAIGFLAALAGAVIGVVALSKHKNQPTARGKTLALLGLVFGSLTFILAIVAVIVLVTLWT